MTDGCCVNRSFLNGSEPVGYLVLIQISLRFLRKAVILKLKEVYIKERSHSASCEVIGQVTGHTTAKWPIRSKAIEGLSAPRFVKIQLACMYIPGVFHLQKNFGKSLLEFRLENCVPFVTSSIRESQVRPDRLTAKSMELMIKTIKTRNQ